MGSNRLEDFIRTHREEFDDRKAPPGLWSKIEQRRRPAQVHILWQWTAVAASVLLILSLGYIMGIKSTDPVQIAGWDEFRETEQFYQGRIDEKLETIQALPVSHEVLTDLQVLDEVYSQMREELLRDPNADPQVLLHAMVKHQQQKLHILDEIINRVEKYKHEENEETIKM